MIDLTFLTQYIDMVTLGLCLCLGYAIKTAKLFEKFGNQYIPLTMLIIGVIIALIGNIGKIDATIVLGGMVSGLASTGLYELLRNLLDKGGKTDTAEE
ncbi:phage holin family protein [Konateibacter massiliensis]|uniref:phage holin family protein n=1 Tax=Konateibacter massiliensis TaxID=2002841 RepID=UPI001F394616|nr:phage holin family protein [Konateibacter massiliensis]